MASLATKITSIAPLESGERVLCAAYVSAGGSSMGSAVIAVSDRNLFFAPRSAFLSRGAWRARRLQDVRIDSKARRSMGFPVAYRFEIVDVEGSRLFFELARKEAQEFRRALGGRLVPKGVGR